MANTPSRKLAVIMHADVVGSTNLVRRNETLAHRRIKDAFLRFSKTIESYGGIAHELRGDALVAEFARASDAVCATVSFQGENTSVNASLEDDLRPQLRVGIAMGEVVVADNTITGTGVVLAQRLEQIAEPGGVCMQGAAYETVPRRLPFTYESLGEQLLKDFDEPVRAYAVRLAPGESLPSPESSDSQKSGLEPSEKPSIAVLPFVNLSGEPEQEYFSDGITEDIIIELSRFPTLFVIARHSSFSLKGQIADVKEVAQRLGVKYVAEGSVRKAGQRVRISVELADARTGEQIWADRYDRALDDIFAVQDEVARMIVSALSGRVARAELLGSERKPTNNLTAYDYFLRGNMHFYRLTHEDNSRAREMFQRATAVDPSFARAHARLGATYNIDAFMGWDSGSSWNTAMECVQKAIGSSDPNPSVSKESEE